MDILRPYIPKMCLGGAEYVRNVPLTEMLKNISRDFGVLDTSSQKRLLIIDDDIEYIEKLRIYLESAFQVFVCKFDLDEIGTLLLKADYIVISTDIRGNMMDFIDMFKLVSSCRQTKTVRVYFLCSSKSKRNYAGAGFLQNATILSKDTDVERISQYLVSHTL